MSKVTKTAIFEATQAVLKEKGYEFVTVDELIFE